MEISSKSLSHGVGGSYTKWQREPPAHRVYEVETPEGQTVVTVYAENRALEDADHPTVQLIEAADEFKSEVDFEDLSDDVVDEIQDHFAEKVKDDEWFQD